MRRAGCVAIVRPHVANRRVFHAFGGALNLPVMTLMYRMYGQKIEVDCIKHRTYIYGISVCIQGTYREIQ